MERGHSLGRSGSPNWLPVRESIATTATSDGADISPLMLKSQESPMLLSKVVPMLDKPSSVPVRPIIAPRMTPFLARRTVIPVTMPMLRSAEANCDGMAQPPGRISGRGA